MIFQEEHLLGVDRHRIAPLSCHNIWFLISSHLTRDLSHTHTHHTHNLSRDVSIRYYNDLTRTISYNFTSTRPHTRALTHDFNFDLTHYFKVDLTHIFMHGLHTRFQYMASPKTSHIHTHIHTHTHTISYNCTITRPHTFSLRRNLLHYHTYMWVYYKTYIFSDKTSHITLEYL